MSVNIKVKKFHSDAILPHYVYEGDAGMDVYSVEEVYLYPGETKLVHTGLGFEIPNGFEIQVRPKSGLALKHGITVLNSPGTLDSGYRGELGIIMQNTSKDMYKIEKGKKIAQIILAKYEEAVIEETKELSDTARSDGGFGSTGLNSN